MSNFSLPMLSTSWGTDEGSSWPEEDVLQMDVLDVRSNRNKPQTATKPVTRGMDQTTKLLVGGVGLVAVWYYFIRK